MTLSVFHRTRLLVIQKLLHGCRILHFLISDNLFQFVNFDTGQTAGPDFCPLGRDIMILVYNRGLELEKRFFAVYTLVNIFIFPKIKISKQFLMTLCEQCLSRMCSDPTPKQWIRLNKQLSAELLS